MTDRQRPSDLDGGPAEPYAGDAELPGRGPSGLRTSPASHCPSCGRFVGPYERCPYCGADVGRRMAVRAFAYGSLVLAILGVAVLLLVARQSEVPVVEIGGLTGTMNWAYVGVEGTVTQQPAYDADDGSLRLWVGDGSGELMVMAYRPEAEWLLTQGLVPVMGDQVRLEGTLRIREEFQYLVLNVPQHTEIRRAEAVEVPIGEVDAGRRYETVTVRGMVRDDRTPYEGLRILTLRDASGAIDVTLAAGVEALPSGAEALASAWPELRAGQGVQVTGAVELYQGTAQISVGRGSDLVPLEEAIPIAPELRISELPAAGSGEMAMVEGTIEEVRPFSAGVKFTLDDGTGRVTLLLWRDLYESLAGSDDLVEGTRVRALGEVAEYGGELEIVAELPADVVVLETAVQTVEERHLGEVEAGNLGRTVQVEGVLRSLRSFSAGVRGILDDGTGTVTLLLWQEVYDSLPEPGALVPGAVLRVEGEVAEYKGELEVIPRAAADLSVVGTVELPMEALAIGQLTAADAGQTVQVDGQIAEVIPFSKGVKYRLDDGTGAITLLLWQDVYEELAEPEALTVTVSLAVRGEVAEYQGELELVPHFPSDIEVTGRGEVAPFAPTPAPGATGQPTSLPTGQPTEEPTSQTPAQPTSPPKPQIERRAIASLTAADVGQVVEVEGVIAGVDYFSSGVKYDLQDGEGRITLLLWQNVMEEVAGRYDLIPGSQVRVRGRIDEYQGELEIAPESGGSVMIVARGEGLPIEERAVGEVTPADEGRIFCVEGRVTRIEGEGWLRVWIDDGTGELLVFVPEREVAYLPAGIGPGVRLGVTGEVDIYQGQLEIIPLAGADVEVR